MTDKEKLLKLIQNYDGTFEDIIFCYLDRYKKDFSALRLYEIIANLYQDYLYQTINNLENVKAVSYEKALYLKSYLEGDMWKTKEATKANVQPQINNAQEIIDVCRLN